METVKFPPLVPACLSRVGRFSGLSLSLAPFSDYAALTTMVRVLRQGMVAVASLGSRRQVLGKKAELTDGRVRSVRPSARASDTAVPRLQAPPDRQRCTNPAGVVSISGLT
jgi:hypothetical protein